ncbi:hypothetical protein PpBr36_02145 [Pyricularia pennisetigena]|uniref:hypothetical protein n=1 Tax=Pyricularia pennisetigena TaxID=1578925 RepID=UPI0011524E2E|nr:hypothetical protein PpBr36_02145 [Pyricularia pennisetigena]TLS28309.1 hypothetical protein PpBr36_02145 [Pyricularia pennisetigena]
MCQYHMFIMFPISDRSCGHMLNLSNVPMEERLRYLSRPALRSVECSVHRQKRRGSHAHDRPTAEQAYSHPTWSPENALGIETHEDFITDDTHIRPRRQRRGRERSPSTASVCTTIEWTGTLAPRWIRRDGDGDCPDCVRNERELEQADGEWDDAMADLAPGGTMPIRAWERKALTAIRDEYVAAGGGSRWNLVRNGRVKGLIRWQRTLVDKWLVNLKGTRAKGDPAGAVEEGEIAGGDGDQDEEEEEEEEEDVVGDWHDGDGYDEGGKEDKVGDVQENYSYSPLWE